MTQLLPEQFETKLHKILLNAGVILIICPHLPKTHLYGATFWLGQNKAVLMLTIRGSWADIFWFTLFHEIGHLMLHGKQMVFLEGEIREHEFDNPENEANRFAADKLIPPNEYDVFLKANAFYQQDIERFARRLGIDPGIVVGRLQHDGHIENSWHNNLRSLYEWQNK
jgi:HTH-type transcriptional regulator/antitoxin HigA